MTSGSEMVAGIPLWLVLGVGGVSLAVHWVPIPIKAERHHRATTCRDCRYGLDGLPEVVRCPECGLGDARRRTEIKRTEHRFAPTWRRPVAFGVLAGFIVLAGLARLLIVEQMMTRPYPVPIWRLYRSHYSAYFLDGWPIAPMVLAAIVVWGMARRNGPGGARLMARAAVCGVAVLGAVSWTTAVDPFASDTDLHARATLVAYMALIVSGVLSGCVLSGLGAMARVVRGIMSRRLIRANRGPSPDDGGSVGVVLDDVACP